MNSTLRYSIIIPVYNRPEEVEELLRSLTIQTYTNFEVLLIEDGSTLTCKEVYERYISKLSIKYFFKPNSGPGPSRNFGFKHALGEYFVVFDSDCILPAQYFSEVEIFLSQNPLDAWGGPDRGHENFTAIQQAMAFTMSSVFTTGGIRGGKNIGDSFQPRSFNMGMSKEVFSKTQGFKFDRFAEDIELSVRIKRLGFQIGYIPNAFVFHKRRTNLKQFFWQVFNFGRGRVLVGKAHSGVVKLTHWFPSLFLLGLIIGIGSLIFNSRLSAIIGLLYFIYWVLLSMDAFKTTRSIRVTLLAGPAAFVQLCGYGAGFIRENLRKISQ